MPTLSVTESVFAFAGFGTACLFNLAARKPIYTGIYKHAALGAAGFYIGRTLEQWNMQKQQEKLLILEDYVRLHPEDFVEEAPKKFRDVVHSWAPVR